MFKVHSYFPRMKEQTNGLRRSKLNVNLTRLTSANFQNTKWHSLSMTERAKAKYP